MENPSLTIIDLSELADIVNTACTRGAFQASEVKKVGEMYEKLTGFIQAVATQAHAEAEGQTQGETK